MSAQRPTNKAAALLSAVFFFSGFSSLIYQVVWQRVLTLYYGVGSVSITLIVGVYMAGLGIGGLLGGFLAERVQKRVLLFFWVELLIGVFGLISLPFLHFLGRHTAGSSYLVSAFYMILFLCLPTLLMGITLPVLVKVFNRFLHNFFGAVSLLYFLNTIGAAAGAAFTSFALISLFGLDVAVYSAAAIDLALALVVWQTARLVGESRPASPPQAAQTPEAAPSASLGKWAYLLVLISGFLAIGYELVWYRLIGVLVKDSPYAFSSILFVYLLGVALGSLWVNRRLAKKPGSDKLALFLGLQVMVGLYVALSTAGYYFLTRDTPLRALTEVSFNTYPHPFPFPPSHLPHDYPPLLRAIPYLDIILWPLVFVLIPTVFMGAGFPLISSLALTRPDREGSTVGTTYFFNIAGNVLGSVLTGFVLLPVLGSERTLFIFAAASMAALVLIPRLGGKTLPVGLRLLILAALLAGAYLVFPKPGRLYRVIHPTPGVHKVYFEEGVDAVVLTYASPDSYKNYINGSEHGVLGDLTYYTWVVEALRHAPAAKNILVIGYGAGTFPKVALELSDLQRLTVVELSEALMRNLDKIPLYAEINRDPRLDLVVDDGRRYLLANPGRYDVILMDPIRQTTAYANNLHSLEFFELASQNLKPEGILFIGGLTEDKVLPKTLATAFEHVRAYEHFVLASNAPIRENLPYTEELMASFDPEMAARITAYAGNHYLGDEAYVRAKTAGYPVNLEWKPNTEYYLGMRLKTALGCFP